MSQPHRSAPRIDPPCPTTVAIGDSNGTVVAYGIVSDISKTGGCIWTDVLLDVGTTVNLRLSFAYPPEVHTLAGSITWAKSDARNPGEHAYRLGVRWLEVGYTLRRRIRQLMNSAVPTSRGELHMFASHWIVGEEWPPQRRMGLKKPPHRDWLGSTEDDGSDTLPPIPRAQMILSGGEVTPIGGGARTAWASCRSCGILRQGQREHGWPVASCGRCGHYRYGTPGVCACRPQHADPEPFERMLQAQRIARRSRPMEASPTDLRTARARNGQEGCSQ